MKKFMINATLLLLSAAALSACGCGPVGKQVYVCEANHPCGYQHPAPYENMDKK